MAEKLTQLRALRPTIPVHSSCLRSEDFKTYLVPKGKARTLNGETTEEFSKLWKNQFPYSHTYPVPSGRYALWYFLEHCQFEVGAEVLIAAYNYYVIVRMLVQKGLKPVFVDIDPATLSIDTADMERKVSTKTCMVLVTHMFGIPADMNTIHGFCTEHKIKLFEDCAHALGSTHETTQVGHLADGALFSFGIAKITNTFGGGMLVMKPSFAANFLLPVHKHSSPVAHFDSFIRFLITLISLPPCYSWLMAPLTRLGDALAEKGHTTLRNFVAPSKNDTGYSFESGKRPAYKNFMTSMQARQLARLGSNIQRRIQIAAIIKTAIEPISHLHSLDENTFGEWNGSYLGVYADDKMAFAKYLRMQGISCNTQEFFDCSRLAQFSEFAADCPNAAYASDHLVRLPNYPSLSEMEVLHIVRTIGGFNS